MTISRRHFLHTASLTVIAGTVLPGALAQSAQSLNDDRFNPDQLSILNRVSPLTFKPFIGEAFDATLAGEFKDRLILLAVNQPDPGKQETKVAGVRFVGPVPKPSQQATQNFSLHFQGSSAALKQDTYTMEHASLGSFPLFIVPAGPGAPSTTYTAFFSLLV